MRGFMGLCGRTVCWCSYVDFSNQSSHNHNVDYGTINSTSFITSHIFHNMRNFINDIRPYHHITRHKLMNNRTGTGFCLRLQRIQITMVIRRLTRTLRSFPNLLRQRIQRSRTRLIATVSPRRISITRATPRLRTRLTRRQVTSSITMTIISHLRVISISRHGRQNGLVISTLLRLSIR